MDVGRGGRAVLALKDGARCLKRQDADDGAAAAAAAAAAAGRPGAAGRQCRGRSLRRADGQASCCCAPARVGRAAAATFPGCGERRSASLKDGVGRGSVCLSVVCCVCAFCVGRASDDDVERDPDKMSHDVSHETRAAVSLVRLESLRPRRVSQ